MRRTPLVALLFACSLVAPGARAADPVFRVTPDSLRANELGEWRANLTLENHGEWGLYADSLTMDWVNADPDSSSLPRHGTRDLNAIVRLASPASAGESTGLEWSAPAEFERGTLVFHISAHDAQKTRYAASGSARVVGSELADAHPSLMLANGGQQVELVMFPADSSARPAPAVLYVPPAGTTARSLLRWALPYQIRGYTMAIVSQSGSGRTSGVPDASGPASVAAVNAALDRLAHEPGVDAKRIVIWGQGDGATTGLLAAAGHPELAGVIAMDAGYDPWAAYRALPEPARAAYVRSAGRDSAAWRARSPLAVATRIAAPVLVLQTLDSGIGSPAAAQAFADARTGRQLYVEARLDGVEPRPFRRHDALRVALDFLARRTHKP
jgi:dienelactone hydrolase